jgi:hypothetical protein
MTSLLTVLSLVICSDVPATQPSGIKWIYVLPMSHLDIGFTAPPSDVAAKMAAATEQALDEAAVNPDYVWNYEEFWQLEQWLTKKPSAERQRQLVELVRSGRFGVGATYHTPHSSLMSEWMLMKLCEPANTWARQAGLKLDWAVLNDMPGHPPDLPRVLARSGVKYLVMGINTGLSVPLDSRFCNHPFWWEAPTGERVLTWISGDAYLESFTHSGFDPGAARMFAKDKFQGDDMAIMHKGISETVARFLKTGYPHDAILRLHAFDNWGSAVSLNLPRFARQWNESGDGPRIRVATPRMFFEHILATAKEPLPVYRGGFGGEWDRIKHSVPTAVRRMRSAETILRKEQVPCDDPRMQSLLTLYEHSFPNGTGWPDLLTESQLLRHIREQNDCVAVLPGESTPWPVHGRAAPLDMRGDGALIPNGLYVANGPLFGQFVSKELKQLGPDAWNALEPRRTEDGVWQFRHRLNRDKLVNRELVVWAWPLPGGASQFRARVRTATGWMQLPEDRLDHHFDNNWFSPWATQIGDQEIEADVPLSFCIDPVRHPNWLFALCFSQSLMAEFKGGVKRTMTVAEVYPTEDPIFEFTIEVRPRR